MYQKLEKCPACESTQLANDQIITDHFLSKESFALSKCSQCQLLFTNPRPSESSISKYYDSKEYISHSNSSASLMHYLYRLVRKKTLSDKYNLLVRHKVQESVLDYGAGTGHFVKYLLQKKVDANGIEPQKQLIQYSDSLNSHIYQYLDSLPSKQKYTAITAWHVIEHVHELRPTLKALRKLLYDSGKIFVALPNHGSYDAKYYQEHWAGWDVPRHLYHFDPDSFEHLAKKSKLRIDKIIPMKYDAFYVSLLSEKYQKDKNSFLRALQIGAKSNYLAKKTNQYSSLIYVLSKK